MNSNIASHYIKEKFSTFLKKFFNYFGICVRSYASEFKDIDPVRLTIIKECIPFSMTSPETLNAMIEATNFIATNNIPGAIVECGVWKGGSMMAAAKTLLQLKRQDIEFYLYDTFSGMTPPEQIDIPLNGGSLQSGNPQDVSLLCRANIEEVRARLHATGYNRDKIYLIKGDVLKTIPSEAPAQISLLRLDTDWYKSTKHELDHLFPRLSKGGILIIDDYGYFAGCKKAVDEYFNDNKISIFLNRVDLSCRLAIKQSK